MATCPAKPPAISVTARVARTPGAVTRTRASDAAWLVATQVVAAASTFGSGIVLARTLGPAGKGYVDLVLASATLLQMLGGLSLGSGVFFHVARGGVDHRRLIGAAILSALGLGLIVAVSLPALAGTALGTLLLPGTARAQAAWLAVALVATLQLQQLLQGTAKGRSRFLSFGLSEVITRAGTLLLVVLLAVGAVRDPVVYLGAALAATVVSVAVLATDGLRGGTTAGATGGATGGALPLRAIVVYSLPLYVGNLVQFLNYRLDVFFVKAVVGLDGVGRYLVAVSLAQTLWLVPNALAALVLRAVAADPASPATRSVVALVTRGCLAVSAVGAIVIALLAGPGVQAIFGQAFESSVPALLLLLPGVALFSVVVTLSAYLNGLGRQALTTWVSCGALVVTIVLNALLVPRLGIAGAALASSASYLASAVATMWIVHRLTPELRIRELLLPGRADLVRLQTLVRQRPARRTGPDNAGTAGSRVDVPPETPAREG